MAGSILSSFVSGTRQMLAVQLVVSVGAVALAGYTLGVTNNVIRDRNRLNDRVIQLEEALAERGVMPPQATPQPVRDAQGTPGYPSAPVEQEVVIDETTPAPDLPAPSDVAPPAQETTPTTPPNTTTPAPTQTADATPQEPQAQPQNPSLDLATQVLRDLLTPPPALRTVVLHVRSRADYDEAQQIAQRLAGSNLRVSIAIREPNDQTATGYAYYHGRQSRPAAEVAQRVQDAARGAEIAAWAVQLRGTALPAQGDYTADRVDIVLPALPVAQPPGTRVNPQILRQAPIQQVQPPATTTPQRTPDLRRVQTQPGVVRQQPEQDPNAPR